MLKFNSLCRYTIWTHLLLLPLCLSADIVRTFEYDKNNQLIKEQKTNGQTVAYEYDSCGRVARTTSSDGITVEYAYDMNGNCTGMTDGHGTTSYSYDLLNQLVEVQFPNSKPLSYKYDTRGRLREMIYPNGWKIAYTYDSSSRLTAVADQTGVTKYEYDDATNTLCKVTLSNGIFTEYQHDPTKRITNVTHKRSSGEIIKSYHYTFDANGNRTQIKETGSFRTKTTLCTYDKLNRLIAVEYPEGYEKFTYDGIGNRLRKETQNGVTHYEYDQHNRLVKAGDAQFFYDQCGNLIKKVSPKETAEYMYDAYDNLIEFRNDKTRVQYAYDGARRRISKNVDGVVTHYSNDVQSPITQVVLQTTVSNEIIYTYGLSRLAEILPKGVGFYLYDYPDRNVIGLVDRDQRIVNEYAYDSFGCCQRIVMDSPNDFLYAGEAYEEESGLIYLRNRYYDPELGRFISADPEFGSTMNPQSLNPYTYVANNPLNYIDPTGLRSAKACAYPAGTKTKDGSSTFGHGFWVLTFDNGKVKTF